MQPVKYIACRTEWLDTLKKGKDVALCQKFLYVPSMLFGRAEGKHVFAKVVVKKWLLFGELRKRRGEIHDCIKKRDGSLLRK